MLYLEKHIQLELGQIFSLTYTHTACIKKHPHPHVFRFFKHLVVKNHVSLFMCVCVYLQLKYVFLLQLLDLLLMFQRVLFYVVLLSHTHTHRKRN